MRERAIGRQGAAAPWFSWSMIAASDRTWVRRGRFARAAAALVGRSVSFSGALQPGQIKEPIFASVQSNPAHQQKHDQYDDDDADDADASVTITIAVTTETATEAAKQEDHENDDEDESNRHGLSPVATLVRQNDEITSVAHQESGHAHRLRAGASKRRTPAGLFQPGSG
jgi:hypothetical protein